MVHYKLIGTGVTGNDGVAHMTKNASGSSVGGYVGTGAGKMDFVCSVEDPDTVTGNDVSTPYEVCDCIFYDDGTTDTPSWDMVAVSKSVESNGKKFLVK